MRPDIICEGLLPSLISDLYGTSPSSDNSPAELIPQEFTIASCLTAYQEQPTVELDLEITAGSYNAKVNLPVCFN